MDKITVREMAAGEEKTVKEIGKRAFTGFESLWVPKPKQALVAVLDGRIVGAVLYKFLDHQGNKTGYVDYAFVDPEFHGLGIGTVLYRKAVSFLWKQGCDALTAIVKDDNVSSWSLFLKNGFSRVSLPELVRQFGFGGMLKHYFATPFCIGIGMEYYVALKDGSCPSGKEGTGKQVFAYLLSNLILIGAAGVFRSHYFFEFAAAFLLLLVVGIVTGFLGTRFSKRGWTFRHNNGGAAICAVINLFGAYPMIGNWYPRHYENTKAFRRDLGVVAFLEWLVLLIIMLLTGLIGSDSGHILALGQISALFLFYRMIPCYPFESFGGRRVLNWNRWVYGLMTFLSAGAIAFGIISSLQ